MHGEHDYTKTTCPYCGEEIIIEFDTARCSCGWFASGADLEEIIFDEY